MQNGHNLSIWFCSPRHSIFLCLCDSLKCASAPPCLWQACMWFFKLHVVPNSSWRPLDCHWFSANCYKSNILSANVKAPPLLVLSASLILLPSRCQYAYIRKSSFCYFCACTCCCYSILAGLKWICISKHFTLTNFSIFAKKVFIRNWKRN